MSHSKKSIIFEPIPMHREEIMEHEGSHVAKFKNVLQAIKKTALPDIASEQNLDTYNEYLEKSQLEPLVLEKIYEEAKTFLQYYNLTFDKNEAKLIWNKEHQFLEYHVKILQKFSGATSDSATSNAFNLAGRTLKIRILNGKSNLTQTNEDYLNRAKNLFESGMDLQAKIFEDMEESLEKKQQKIEFVAFYEAINLKLKILNPHNKKDHHQAINLFRELNSRMADMLNSQVSPQNTDKVKENLINLRYLNKDVDRRSLKEFPKDAKHWLKILQLHESSFIANNKNDVLFNVYRDPSNTRSKLWVIEKNIPLSDLPSSLRNATGKILPNWFHINTKIFKVDNDNAYLVNEFDHDRSSSFSAIAMQPHLRSEQTANIAKTKLKQMVKESLIKKLRDHYKELLSLQKEIMLANAMEDTKKAIFHDHLQKKMDIILKSILTDACYPKTLVMTLLNLPFHHKEERKRIPEEFSEGPQYFDAKSAFKNLQPFKLEQKDIDEILDRVFHDNGLDVNAVQNLKATLQESLSAHPIKHQEVFINFATSGVRWFSRENKQNDQELPHIIVWVKGYLITKLQLHGAISNLFYATNFSNIKQLKKLYKELNKLYNNSEYLEVLSLYIKYLELSKISFIGSNENLLRPSITALLCNRLGKNVHITCKSGEDRTGAVAVAINCALCTENRLAAQNNKRVDFHTSKGWKDFKKDFWNNYLRTEELSSSRYITDLNAKGARGLQAQSGSLFARMFRMAPSPVAKYLSLSDKMARIHKAPFKKYIKQNKSLSSKG